MLRDLRFKRNVSITFLLFCFLGSLQLTFAEGSKDWYPAEADDYTGDKRFRSCVVTGVPTGTSNVCNISAPFPTYGTMKVYAKSGEKIYVASSVMMVSGSHIDWRSPDGSNGSFSYADTKTQTIGVIANRTKELAGPNKPGETAGYDAFVIDVQDGQEGVWEIDFCSGGPTLTYSGGNYDSEKNLLIKDWVQNTNTSNNYSNVICAFDISVLNQVGDAFIPGRVYTNVLNTLIATYTKSGGSKYSGEWFTKFYVLTNTSYLYEVDPNGQSAHNATFFANNKGVQEDDDVDSRTKYVSPGISSPMGGTATHKSKSGICDGNSRFKDQYIPVYDPRRPDNIQKVMNEEGELVDSIIDVTHKSSSTNLIVRCRKQPSAAMEQKQ